MVLDKLINIYTTIHIDIGGQGFMLEITVKVILIIIQVLKMLVVHLSLVCVAPDRFPPVMSVWRELYGRARG